MNHIAEIARELGLDHMEVYKILYPYERCGLVQDTVSPCALCNVTLSLGRL